jgi:hypothetical protein
MSLFLSREIGSIETGPQTFAGTDVPNTTFIFRAPFTIPQDPPGLLNSVLIQNAGRNELNGIFVYVTEFNNKPYYVNNNNSNLFILWFNDRWEIYDFSIDNLPIYFSSENVLYPWVVTNWSISNSIYIPVPTVTKIQ